jgi:predicted RNase H-like HicB family nuclease
MKKYRAVYEREDDGRWTVRIPQVPGCHSYGRTIDQARERIREALSLFVSEVNNVELVDDIHLPADVKKLVRGVIKLREKVAEEERAMVAAQVVAVKTLRKTLKLGHRDAGALLGLSHQRIHQLEKRQTAAVASPRAMAHERRGRGRIR